MPLRPLFSFLLMLGLLALPGRAETIRVSTWILGSGTGSPESRLQTAAEALRQLDPDVILVQQARDWQMCAQLAQALKPAEYTVAVCSSFRGPWQVAILAKQKAYFSWSEAWPVDGTTNLPGGFAFAAIRVEHQPVGFFCVQLDEHLAQIVSRPQTPESAQAQSAYVQRWLNAIEPFRNWTANRLQGAVVAGGFDPRFNQTNNPTQLQGFTKGFLSSALDEVVGLPEPTDPEKAAREVLHAHLGTSSQSLAGIVLASAPVTCDLELNPAPASAHPVVTLRPKGSPTAAAVVAKPEPVSVPAAVTNPAAKVSAPTAGSQPSASSRAKVAAPVAASAALAKVTSARSAAPKAKAARLPLAWLLAGALGAGLLGLVSLGLWRKRQSRRSSRVPALAAGNPEPGTTAYTIVVAPQSVTGSVLETASPAPRPLIHIERAGSGQTQSAALPPRELRPQAVPPVEEAGLRTHLAQWLKQKLLQRLLSDRAQLLASQQVAAAKVLSVEERLARLEVQIQQQNQAYEQRIEELNRELLAAKEENRELIRARINQVKAEMEAARAKILQQANLPGGPV